MRGALQTLNHSLELMRAIGNIFDFLLIDSYQFEDIFNQISKNKQVIKLVIQLVTEHAKIKAVQKSITKSGNS